MTYTWTDNPTVSGVSVCDTDILNDDIMYLKENLDNRYVVAKSDKSLMPSYWIEYNDGWCVQGGFTSAGGFVEFLKPYLDNNFALTYKAHHNGKTKAHTSDSTSATRNTVASYTFYGSSDGTGAYFNVGASNGCDGYSWRAEGYIR